MSELPGFDLTKTPLLKGFTPTRDPKRFGTMFERDSAFHLSSFHGPTELRYHVFKFSTEEELDRWDAKVREYTPAWISPARNPKQNGVRRGLLGGPQLPHTRPRVAFVGTFAIVVYGFQHGEMVRRQPQTAKLVVHEQQLGRLMDQVTEELIRRAKKDIPPA